MGRTATALANVVVNVAVRVGQRQSMGGCGKVSSHARLAGTVLALQARKADTIVLVFAAASRAILFGKAARFHLLQETIEAFCDEFSIRLANDRGWSVKTVARYEWGAQGTQITRRSREPNAVFRVDHAQSHGRLFPALATTASP